jgi:hypothetical protein
LIGIPTSESGGQVIANDVGRAPERVRVEVRISRDGSGLRMTQELSDDWQAEAGARANRCEGVPQVMDADAFEPRVPLNRSPSRLEVGTKSIDVRSRDDKGTSALAIPQKVNRGCAHDDCLSACLAIGEIDEPALKIYMAPLKGQNLAQSSARGHQ